MGNFEPEKGNGADLSLDKYIKQLIDFKKAIKIFEMSGTKPYAIYVGALQYAIDVAQGKSAVSDAEKKAVLDSAKELTRSALGFHNKVAQIREDIKYKQGGESAEPTRQVKSR